MDTAELQRRLKAAGFNPGPVDGSFGRRTIAALKDFQKAKGLQVDGVVGPMTFNALKPVTLADVARPAPPPWYAEALHLKGTKEVPGAASNAKILAWAKSLGGWVARVYANDGVAWCGLFAGHCVGYTLPGEALPSNPLSALAWASFGRKLEKPALGAICVFKRKGGGHVGFYAGEDATAVHVLGGNQSDQVSIARVSKDRLVGYRWPLSGPQPEGGTVQRTASGAISRNEA